MLNPAARGQGHATKLVESLVAGGPILATDASCAGTGRFPCQHPRASVVWSGRISVEVERDSAPPLLKAVIGDLPLPAKRSPVDLQLSHAGAQRVWIDAKQPCRAVRSLHAAVCLLERGFDVAAASRRRAVRWRRGDPAQRVGLTPRSPACFAPVRPRRRACGPGRRGRRGPSRRPFHARCPAIDTPRATRTSSSETGTGRRPNRLGGPLGEVLGEGADVARADREAAGITIGNTARR